MSQMIQLHQVSRSFGSERVVKQITHTFQPGQIHGIVGNNGSGKTVLMKCICGFLPVSEGRILVDGKEVGKEMDFPHDLGVIIETPGFLRNLTGRRNLEILASLQGRIGRKEIDHALRTVGLDPDLKKTVGQYSLGMRQRLGIAQAIMEHPTLLILDEPMNGLDKSARREMQVLFQRLRDQGTTILLASHFSEDIQVLCDTVCEMEDGVLRVIK